MEQQIEIDLPKSWLTHLREEFNRDYMVSLKQFLLSESNAGKVIYPRGSEIFHALKATPLDQVKVVILGQDPYHGVGQAHGLCFSVRPDVASPPSLVNIYKEIQRDLGLPIPNHGCLQRWAEQGVLLLNTVLTVEAHKAGSHQNRGWERFTDRIIELLNQQERGIVFMLWGSHAQKKGQSIDKDRHLVLKAPHPSPLSAYRGFLGCGHFSAVNQFLESTGQKPIDWRL